MRFWGLNYANDCCSRMEYREGAQPIQLPDRVGSTGRDELRSANSSQPSTRFAPGWDFKEVCSDHDRTKGDMSLTVILTNYKRPENVRRLIQALSQQTVKPTLFVWDNSSEQDCDDPRIDWLIRSSQNAKCSPSHKAVLPERVRDRVDQMPSECYRKGIGYLLGRKYSLQFAKIMRPADIEYFSPGRQAGSLSYIAPRSVER